MQAFKGLASPTCGALLQGKTFHTARLPHFRLYLFVSRTLLFNCVDVIWGIHVVLAVYQRRACQHAYNRLALPNHDGKVDLSGSVACIPQS